MARKKATGEEGLSRSLWMFLLYPLEDGDKRNFASMEELWKFLDDMMCPLVVSPLHDRDVKEDGSGELKKPHYHVMVEFDGPKPYKQVLKMFEPLGVNILKQVPSRKTFERYTCHLDSPSKVKYDVADIKTFGGYVLKYLGDRYEQSSIQEIHKLIEELGIVYYADLANQIGTAHPDLLTTLLRYTGHFNNVCYSRERLVKESRRTNLMSSYKASRTMIGE